MTSKLSLGLVVLPFVPSSIVQGQEQEVRNERPNIIFIMSDDHARQAMSIYGHPIGKVAPTPNIDRIGHEGAVFQNNYCCNSISGPSRAAILTGKHSHKNGFMKNWAKGFDGTQQTLPKILQANGYETAVIGKWHLISKPTGFDHWMILDDQGEYCNPHFITENDTTRHLGYVTDLITKYTEEWLDGRKGTSPRQKGRLQAARELPHLLGGSLLHLAEHLVDRRHDHVLQHLDVLRVDRLGLDREGEDLLLAVGLDRDHAAAGGGLVLPRLQLLDLGELFLHLLGLLEHLLHVSAGHSRESASCHDCKYLLNCISYPGIIPVSRGFVKGKNPADM